MLMTKMREWSKNIILIVIVAFVATIFLAWGMDFTRNWSQREAVGKINGEEISFQQFKMAFDRVYQEMQRRETEQGEPSEFIVQNAKAQAWQQFIEEYLLRAEFKRYKLETTESQLYNYFHNNPPPEFYQIDYFKGKDSLFDTSKYYAFLNNPQAFDNPGVRALEENARDFIIPYRTFQSLVLSTSLSNDLEAERNWRESSQRVRLEYIKLDLNKVAVDSNALSEGELRAYYEAHPDSFKTKGRFEVAFVQIRKTASQRDEDRIQNDLAEMKKQIETAQISFAEAAKNESEDVSAKDSGSLGWFGKGAMVPPFDSAAFVLPKGQVSDPIRTTFGWHIIKVEDHRKTDNKADEVFARHILIKVTPSLETLDSLRELIDTLQQMAINTKDLLTSGHKAGLPALMSGLFEKGSVPSIMGRVNGLSAFVAKADTGAVSEVLEGKEVFCVCQLKKKIKEGRLPPDLCKAEAKRALMEQKSEEKAKAELQVAAQKLQSGSAMKDLSAANPLLEYGITDTVTSVSFVAGLAPSSPVMIRALSQKPAEVRDPVLDNHALWLVRTLYREEPDPEMQRQNIAANLEQLANRKRYQAYGAWLEMQKKNAKIEEDLDKYFPD